MAYQILSDKCKKSGMCIGECPMEAIVADASGRVKIDPAMCTDCGTCSDICPQGAVRGVVEGED